MAANIIYILHLLDIKQIASEGWVMVRMLLYLEKD